MKKKPVGKASPKTVVPSPSTAPARGKPYRAELPASPAEFGDLQSPVLDDWRTTESSPAVSRAGALPPGLELLAEMKGLSPVELVAALFPNAAASPKVMEKMAALLSGGGLDLGVPLPEWVKAASEKAWQGVGCGFFHELKNGEPEALGTFVELLGFFPKDDKATAPEDVVHKLAHYIKAESGHLPLDDFQSFAVGRSAASKINEKLNSPAERIIAFAVVAVAWREVEKLGSRTKTYKWLKEQKVISPYTEWDEVKNWLKEINLPKGKAGAPRKIGGTAKSTIPVFLKKPKSGL